MTPIQRMRQELIRRNYSATTIRSYIKAVEHFEGYVETPLDQLGPDDLRSYHAYASPYLRARIAAASTKSGKDRYKSEWGRPYAIRNSSVLDN